MSIPPIGDEAPYPARREFALVALCLRASRLLSASSGLVALRALGASRAPRLHFAGTGLVTLLCAAGDEATVDTAVLPTTPPPPPRRAVPTTGSSTLPPPPPAQPRSPSPPLSPSPAARGSAPRALRAAVLLLLVVVLGASLGLVALRTHPAWFSSWHRGQRATAAPATVGRATGAPFALVSSSSAGATYRVRAKSYTIAFSIDHPCWVLVQTLPPAAAPVLAATLQPGAATPVALAGSATVMVAARTNAITVRDGGRTIGVIHSPVVGSTYTLLAEPH